MTCTNCKNLLEESKFSVHSTSTMGVRSQCKKCLAEKRKEQKEERRIYNLEYRKKFPQFSRARELNTRAKKKGLIADLTKDDITRLGTKCALTGEENADYDHVIPLFLRYEGSTYSNMMPLSSRLNNSKRAHNVFVWARVMHKELGFTMERFNEVMTEIAARNEMTLEEYRHYVYWCHDIERCVSDEPYKREVTPC